MTCRPHSLVQIAAYNDPWMGPEAHVLICRCSTCGRFWKGIYDRFAFILSNRGTGLRDVYEMAPNDQGVLERVRSQ